MVVCSDFSVGALPTQRVAIMSFLFFCPSLTNKLLLWPSNLFCGYSKEYSTMRSRIRRQCYYDARVNDINLEDITSSEKNANILRALRDEPAIRYKIGLYTDEDRELDDYDFVIREGDDLGWLGYFIGKSKYLETLCIDSLPGEGEQIDALTEGIARNTTITNLVSVTDFGGAGYQELGPFFRSNRNLSTLIFVLFDIERQQAQSIASVLSQMQHNSMKTFMFRNNIILSEEGFEEICGALTSQPQLQILSLQGSNIGRNDCMALGNMLSSWHAPSLQHLSLEDNSIDDRGLQALVTGMTNCNNLLLLTLSGNRSITAAGLRSLSTLFQSGNCSLIELCLERMNIGDEGAAALAEALVGNKSLKRLYFDVDIAGITGVGWSAFSKLLCDTSSTNSTYLSNHTLQWIGAKNHRGTPEDVKKYLDFNKVSVVFDRNKQDVAILKILGHNIDSLEFSTESQFRFQWKLKFLPFVVAWFERARSAITILAASNEGIDLSVGLRGLETMKLSAVHKFVRGMPLLIIDGYNSRRTSTRLSRKRRLDGEIK